MGGANAWYFIRDNAGTRPDSINHDAQRSLARLDGDGDFERQVRIVHRVLAVSAAIQHLITCVFEKDLQLLFEDVPAMIRTQRNSSVGRFQPFELFGTATL